MRNASAKSVEVQKMTDRPELMESVGDVRKQLDHARGRRRRHSGEGFAEVACHKVKVNAISEFPKDVLNRKKV